MIKVLDWGNKFGIDAATDCTNYPCDCSGNSAELSNDTLNMVTFFGVKSNPPAGT